LLPKTCVNCRLGDVPLLLSESPSRSGEEVSPKREDAKTLFPLFELSLERESLSPERDLSA